jgi:hypothetical protein
VQTFQGTLQATSDRVLPLKVTFQVDDGRIRMWSDRNRIGSWAADQVHIRRESIFRFLVTIDEEEYAFTPEDPVGFAGSVNVEIDLTSGTRSRFGLADRLRQVADLG